MGMWDNIIVGAGSAGERLSPDPAKRVPLMEGDGENRRIIPGAGR